MSGPEMNEREQLEYDLMMELERLETLKEEMQELGVSSLEEIDARMEELHQRLDAMEAGG